MTLDQIASRASVARRSYPSYLPFVERCELILQQAHEFGWKIAVRLNDEGSIRRAESLFGTHLCSDFPESTPLSKLIYGI